MDSESPLSGFPGYRSEKLSMPTRFWSRKVENPSILDWKNHFLTWTASQFDESESLILHSDYPVSILRSESFRLTMLINTFQRNTFLSTEMAKVLESARAGLLEFFTINLIMILFERSQSTVKAAKYETYFALKQSICLTVAPVSYSTNLGHN